MGAGLGWSISCQFCLRCARGLGWCVMGTEFQFREVKPWEMTMVMVVHQSECPQCHWAEQLHMVKTVGFILRDFTKNFF